MPFVLPESLSNSASELLEQTIISLEELRERLNEITGELQLAAKEKMNLSKAKLNELSEEVKGLVVEFESFTKFTFSKV